jgi:hypothetical protein
MKIKYSSFNKIRERLLMAAAMLGLSMSAQNSYTFTNCGATGQYGPSQAQVNTAYAGTSLQNSVVCTGGIQSFTIPFTSNYSVVVAGAAAGSANSFGGRGRIVSGTAMLTAGTVYNILVGQVGFCANPGTQSSGGGGGSFISTTTNSPVMVGGGGAGFCTSVLVALPSSDGNIATNGFTSYCGTGAGGTNGNGGNGTNSGWGGGGGGFFTNGTAASACAGTGGTAFVNGGYGAGPTCYTATGGFGGGGGTHGNTGGGGGGGGYSGGGGSNQNINPNAGGGGGSYIDAIFTNTLDVGTNTAMGYVIITQLCNNSPSPAVDATPISNYTVCPNKTTTLSATGAGTLTWYPSSTSSVVLATGTDVVTSNTLTAGTYSLWAQVTNTCSSSTRTPITFTVMTPPAVNIATLSPVCTGYSVSLSASGANTYSWSNGATTATINAPASGQYSVVGTDAVTGCTNMAVSSLSLLPAPSLTITGPSTVCAGTTVTLTASGSDTYFWNIGSTNPSIVLAVNTTTLMSLVGTFTTNGCTTSVQKTITSFPNPILSVTGNTTICADAGITLTLTASGATSYFWSTGANSNSIVVMPNVSTNYSVVGVYTTACNSTASAPVTVINCTGIKTNGMGDKGISVYPNPASYELTIECRNGAAKSYEIYDLTGRAVIRGSSEKDQTLVDISSLARGLYYVKVSSINGSEMFKIVKQ